MGLEASCNLKQFWESLRQFVEGLELFRKFSVAFRGLWQIQNGSRGF